MEIFRLDREAMLRNTRRDAAGNRILPPPEEDDDDDNDKEELNDVKAKTKIKDEDENEENENPSLEDLGEIDIIDDVDE